MKFDWTCSPVEALLPVPAESWLGQYAARVGGLGSVGPDVPDPKGDPT